MGGGLSFVYLVITFFYPERKLIHMKGMIGGGILKLKQLLLTIGVTFTFYTIILVVLLYLIGNFNIVYAVSLVFSTVYRWWICSYFHRSNWGKLLPIY